MIELLNMDCMEYMATLPDKAFDLAIVDPPYGIGEDGGKKIVWKTRPNSKNIPIKHIAKGWDNKPSKNYFTELFRVSREQIIWGGNYFTDLLPVSGRWIVWDKMIEVAFFTTCELAWCSPRNNQIKRFRIHPFHNLHGGKYKHHPTQKPVALYQWLLKNYAKPGDRILDTHLGSGSSAIAADIMGFDFVGIEIDEDYYKAAVDRFNRHKQQLTLEL